MFVVLYESEKSKCVYQYLKWSSLKLKFGNNLETAIINSNYLCGFIIRLIDREIISPEQRKIRHSGPPVVDFGKT